MERIRDAFEQGHFVLDLKASDIVSASRKAVRHMVADGILPEQMADRVASALAQRERETPTAIGHAVGIPPCVS